MSSILDAALANPWSTLEAMLDGPLHPGGTDATADLLARADVGPESRVLDVGCGAGEALSVARDRGADAVGIDPSPGADRAIRGDATALPIRDSSVDVLLAECVLCLTDLPTALGEARRVLVDGGRLAVSDVVVDGDADGPPVPDRVAEALCLSGARSRDRLRSAVEAAGFEVRTVTDHHDDLLTTRDRVADRVDYEGLLGLLGQRGRRALDAIETLETAVENREVGYVSVVADATR